MSLPSSLKGWYDSGPWVRVNESFHSYYGQEECKRQNWIYFEENDAHELAHALCADSSNLYRYDWGLAMTDPTLPTPPELWEIECKVFAYQIILEEYYGVWGTDLKLLDGRRYQIGLVNTACLLRPRGMPRQEAYSIIAKVVRATTIDQLWEKYQQLLQPFN